jgi:hypothetical protein
MNFLSLVMNIDFVYFSNILKKDEKSKGSKKSVATLDTDPGLFFDKFLEANDKLFVINLTRRGKNIINCLLKIISISFFIFSQAI